MMVIIIVAIIERERKSNTTLQLLVTAVRFELAVAKIRLRQCKPLEDL